MPSKKNMTVLMKDISGRLRYLCNIPMFDEHTQKEKLFGNNCFGSPKG